VIERKKNPTREREGGAAILFTLCARRTGKGKKKTRKSRRAVVLSFGPRSVSGKGERRGSCLGKSTTKLIDRGRKKKDLKERGGGLLATVDCCEGKKPTPRGGGGGFFVKSFAL